MTHKLFNGVFVLDSIRNILMGRVKIAAISLDEIVSSKSRLNRNSLNCSTGLLNFSSNDSTYVYKVVCSEKDSKTDGHKVSIQLQDDPIQVPDKKDLEVKVNCTCPAFLYQGGQFNLYQRDALLGNARGKLVPPKVRDPVRVNYGCKHVFAAIRKLLDKFKKEAPLTEEELEAPEEIEALVPELGPPSPFKEEEGVEQPDEQEKIFAPFKDRMVMDQQEVPRTLLPNFINTKAVEEMEEETIPTIGKSPDLFEQEEEEGIAKSVFRPRKKLFKYEEPQLQEKEESEPINLDEKESGLPSKPLLYQLTPKHLDDEDEEDLEDVNALREKNRKIREKKVKSLFDRESLSQE